MQFFLILELSLVYFTVYVMYAVSKFLDRSQDLFFLCNCWELYIEKSDIVGRRPVQPGDRDHFSPDVKLLSNEVVYSLYIVLFRHFLEGYAVLGEKIVTGCPLFLIFPA